MPPRAPQPRWLSGSEFVKGFGPKTLRGSIQLHPIFLDQILNRFVVIQNVTQELPKSAKMTTKTSSEIIEIRRPLGRTSLEHCLRQKGLPFLRFPFMG